MHAAELCIRVHCRSKGSLNLSYLPHVLQSPIIEELGLLAITITPRCSGLMGAGRHTECFMEPVITAAPGLGVAGWNYLLLRVGVIKSTEWPPDIITGWAARLRNTWGLRKKSTFTGISRDFEDSTTTAPAATTELLFRFSLWLKCAAPCVLLSCHKLQTCIMGWKVCLML